MEFRFEYHLIIVRCKTPPTQLTVAGVAADDDTNAGGDSGGVVLGLFSSSDQNVIENLFVGIMDEIVAVGWEVNTAAVCSLNSNRTRICHLYYHEVSMLESSPKMRDIVISSTTVISFGVAGLFSSDRNSNISR